MPFLLHQPSCSSSDGKTASQGINVNLSCPRDGWFWLTCFAPNQIDHQFERGSWRGWNMFNSVFLDRLPLIMIISQMREFLHQFRWKSTLGMKLWWRRAFFFLLWQQNCTSQPEVPQTTEKCRVSKVTMLWSGEWNFVEPLLIIMTIYASSGLGGGTLWSLCSSLA